MRILIISGHISSPHKSCAFSPQLAQHPSDPHICIYEPVHSQFPFACCYPSRSIFKSHQLFPGTGSPPCSATLIWPVTSQASATLQREWGILLLSIFSFFFLPGKLQPLILAAASIVTRSVTTEIVSDLGSLCQSLF